MLSAWDVQIGDHMHMHADQIAAVANVKYDSSTYDSHVDKNINRDAHA